MENDALPCYCGAGTHRRGRAASATSGTAEGRSRPHQQSLRCEGQLSPRFHLELIGRYGYLLKHDDATLGILHQTSILHQAAILRQTAKEADGRERVARPAHLPTFEPRWRRRGRCHCELRSCPSSRHPAPAGQSSAARAADRGRSCGPDSRLTNQVSRVGDHDSLGKPTHFSRDMILT
jgi:hypothetical protein